MGILAMAPFGAPVSVDPAILEVVLSPWARVFAFVWGALWGSFANVVIYRIPRGMSVVRPGSRCGHCEKPIAWYDNIPIVSYLALRGKCRHCKTKYSPRYLMVELLSGVLCFAIFMLDVVSPVVAGGGVEGLLTWQLHFLLALSLVVVTYTDLDLWIIPNEVVLPVGVLGLAVSFLDPTLLGVDWVEALGAALAGYVLVWTIRFIYLRWRDIEAMGLGDGKLLFMVAAFTGWKGLLWTLAAGALQGLIVSVPMLLLGKNIANTSLEEVHGDDPELGEEDPDGGVMGNRVPFGPFLALAGLELVLLGSQIDELTTWLMDMLVIPM